MVLSVRRFVHLTVSLVLFALPGSAVAQQTNAPPGNAGIDEYVEIVPEATGGKSLRAPSGRPTGSLSAGERRELEALGEDGKALAEVIEATGPSTSTSSEARRPAPSAAAGAERGQAPVTAVVEAVAGGGSGGMGLLLPIILGSTLALMAAAAVARRRSAR
jgi:hypothetical protein